LTGFSHVRIRRECVNRQFPDWIEIITALVLRLWGSGDDGAPPLSSEGKSDEAVCFLF
jgi:hypothetical protein